MSLARACPALAASLSVTVLALVLALILALELEWLGPESELVVPVRECRPSAVALQPPESR